MARLCDRPAMSNNVIFHLLYRGGTTIAGREPLLSQHSQRGLFRRLFVVFRAPRSLQATSNLESATIQYFETQPTITTLDSRALSNANDRTEQLHEHEFLYLAFG